MDGLWELEWSGSWGSGLAGRATISSPSQLAAGLQVTDPNGDAEFTLGHPAQPYPYLLLSVHAERWYVHYFPAEGEPGAFALGDPAAEGWIRHPAGSDIEVAASSLLAASVAEALAAEFLKTGQRPTGVTWFDL